MMLSAKLDQCAALFAQPAPTPEQHRTENTRRLAPQSPTELAKAPERSALSKAKRQKGSKNHKDPSSPSRSTPFSIYHDTDQPHSPEKKVTFDLTQNEVHGFKKKEPPSPRVRQWRVEATWELHQPGINDFMSGAVAGASTSRHRFTSQPSRVRIKDDNTVALFDLDAAVKAMPFKVVSRWDLEALNIFEDGFPDDIIGGEFHITYLGIQRAIEDAEDIMRYGHETWTYDEILVGQLARRAGLFPELHKVQYVEDMVPVIGEGDENFDQQYWVLVWSHTSFWDGLSEATKEAMAEPHLDSMDGETSF